MFLSCIQTAAFVIFEEISSEGGLFLFILKAEMLSDDGLNSVTAANGLCEWRKCHAAAGGIRRKRFHPPPEVGGPRQDPSIHPPPVRSTMCRQEPGASRGIKGPHHDVQQRSRMQIRTYWYSTGNGVRSHAAGEPTCSLG
jgi:hypothetical protein